MNRRDAVLALLALGTAPLGSLAQQPGKVYRIGFIGNSRAASEAAGLTQAFEIGLRDLGWIERKNVTFEYRWSENQFERFPEMASELIGLNVDLIVTTAGATSALAAKKATAAIPILFALAADPVKFGLVASFAHPGGNVTGNALPIVEWGKWLQLAREAVHGASRVAVIANPTNITYTDYVAQNEAAARRLGLQLQMLPVARAEKLPEAFAAMKREHAHVLVFGPDSLYISHLKEILELARANRLPVIAPIRSATELGALMSYGIDIKYIFRQTAAYADKILRGAKPSDLPVEQPARFEVVINLKTAKALGLTIPQSVLLQATDVIE